MVADEDADECWASSVGDLLEICGRQRHRCRRERTSACRPERADAREDEQEGQEEQEEQEEQE